MVKEIIKDEFFLKQKSKSCTKEDLYIANELLETIVEFKRIYPEVNISVVSGTHEELFELLVQHHIDVKISEQRRTFKEDYYNYELKHSECLVEISSMNPLSQKDVLTTDD